MSFLRFYEGAIPGQKRKHTASVDQDEAHKKKVESWRVYEQKRGGRSFSSKWKEGRDWLTFNSESDMMTCTYCTDLYKGKDGKPTSSTSNLKGQNSFVDGCKNMRISTVVEHEQSKSHIKASDVYRAKFSNAVELKQSKSAKALLSLKSVDRSRLCNLFRNAHAIAKKNRPLSDYVWLCDIDRAKGLEIGNTYINEKAPLNFITSIAEVEMAKTVSILQQSNFFSFIMDGSTDISGDEQESVYIQCSYMGNVTVRFLHIGSPPSTCSKDLYQYLIQIFESNGIDREKLIGMGSDGAANMVGTKSGLLALIKKDLHGEFFNVHCLCHRLELAFRDVFKKFKLYDKLMTLLIGLFYFYKKSYNNKKGLLNTFSALELKGILPPKITGTRWLPHLSRGLVSIIRNFTAYEAHLSTLSHGNPKAEGLYKIMMGKDIITFILFLQVLLEPLMKLSMKLQRSNITLADSMLWIKSTSDLISDLKPRENANLSEVLKSGSYKGTSLRQGGRSSSNYEEEIVSGVVNAMQERFNLNPDENNLINCTRILNLKAWPIEDATFGDFGNEEVIFVCKYYKIHLSTANKTFEIDDTMLEWKLLKKFLNRRFDKLCTMEWSTVMPSLDDDFKNIINVIDLLLSLPPTSVSCETSFSQMKLIKTTRRSSMTANTLNNLLTVKLTSPDIKNFKAEESVEQWLLASFKPKGHRRINYQRKKSDKHAEMQDGPPEDLEATEPDDAVDIQDNIIEVINDVYADEFDDDFSYEAQDEETNFSKIMDYANAQ